MLLRNLTRMFVTPRERVEWGVLPAMVGDSVVVNGPLVIGDPIPIVYGGQLAAARESVSADSPSHIIQPLIEVPDILLGDVISGAGELPVERAVITGVTSSQFQIDNTALPARFVSELVERQDRRPDPHRANPLSYTHVTDLIDMCPRRYALLLRNPAARLRTWRSGHRVTFALGRAAEHHVRTQVIESVDDGAVYGEWSCLCGNIVHTGFLDDADEDASHCGVCDGHLTDRYGEPLLTNVPFEIQGRPDLTLWERGMVVVEIKSMAAAQWRELVRPLGDHILQALIYRWLYREAGYGVRGQVVLLYVCKEFSWETPYKEFHIDATSDESVNVVAQVRALAMEARDARLTMDGTLPPRTQCGDSNCSRARNCPVVATCFNMESSA